MLLSDEELQELLGVDFKTAYSGHIAEYQAVAQAQLKKVVEILGGYQIDMGREDVDKFPMVYLRILDSDWQALQEKE